MSDVISPAVTPGRFRPSRRLLAIAAAIVAAVVLAMLLISPAPSARSATVGRLIEAARSGDQPAISRLTTPDAKLFLFNDYIATPDAATFGKFIGKCRPIRTFEGPDTVSLQFNCARDARGLFFVDFRFCGARVHRISWPELGRWVRSPVARDLWERVTDQLRDDDPPCPSN